MDILNLQNTISAIIKYGYKNIDLTDDEKIKDLNLNLCNILVIINSSEIEVDDKEYSSPPTKELKKYMEKIKANFPKFNYYNFPLSFTYNLMKSEIGLRNPFDDLCDIVNILTEVKWRIENTSINDALWHLNGPMYIHLTAHILGLLNYLHYFYLEKEDRE